MNIDEEHFEMIWKRANNRMCVREQSRGCRRERKRSLSYFGSSIWCLVDCFISFISSRRIWWTWTGFDVSRMAWRAETQTKYKKSFRVNSIRRKYGRRPMPMWIDRFSQWAHLCISIVDSSERHDAIVCLGDAETMNRFVTGKFSHFPLSNRPVQWLCSASNAYTIHHTCLLLLVDLKFEESRKCSMAKFYVNSCSCVCVYERLVSFIYNSMLLTSKTWRQCYRCRHDDPMIWHSYDAPRMPSPDEP